MIKCQALSETLLVSVFSKTKKRMLIINILFHSIFILSSSEFVSDTASQLEATPSPTHH